VSPRTQVPGARLNMPVGVFNARGIPEVRLFRLEWRDSVHLALMDLNLTDITASEFDHEICLVCAASSLVVRWMSAAAYNTASQDVARSGKSEAWTAHRPGTQRCKACADLLRCAGQAVIDEERFPASSVPNQIQQHCIAKHTMRSSVLQCALPAKLPRCPSAGAVRCVDVDVAVVRGDGDARPAS
jgi:hypothetical protein